MWFPFLPYSTECAEAHSTPPLLILTNNCTRGKYCAKVFSLLLWADSANSVVRIKQQVRVFTFPLASGN